MSQVSRKNVLALLKAQAKTGYWYKDLAIVLKARGASRKKLKSILEQLQHSHQIIQDKNGRYLFSADTPQKKSKRSVVKTKSKRPSDPNGRKRNGREDDRSPELLVGSLKHLQGDQYEILPLRKKFPILFRADKSLELPTKFRPTELYKIVFFKSNKPGKHPLSAKAAVFLGDISDPSIDSELVIAEKGIEDKFPIEALETLDTYQENETYVEEENRIDLRHLDFVTIDGEDARDFDDAVFLEDDYTLWVAIADVAHYVQGNTALDEHAADRGNSFYFPDKVVPMLPEKLSNHLCSLRPLEDKRSMVLKIIFDRKYEVSKVHLYEAWIKSKARLTYTQVQKLIDQKNDHEVPSKLCDMLLKLHVFSRRLRAKRFAEGSIGFDLSESKIELNEHGDPKSVRREHQNEAQQLIEECMLISNVCVAEFLQEHFSEAVYRVHEPPVEAKLFDFAHFLEGYGIEIDNPLQLLDHKHFNQLTQKIENMPIGNQLLPFGLRAMSQAHYAPKNQGHFALAFENYCHFTSPIRRYADLVVHRLVKQSISKAQSQQRFPKVFQTLETLCVHISSQERVAQKAEREVQQRKFCRYIEDRVGEKSVAVVSGMNPRGLFLELVDEPVEGFLSMRFFRRERYMYFERENMMVSKQGNRHIRIGDQLDIEIDRVDIKNAYIDFRPPMSGGHRTKKQGSFRGKATSRQGKPKAYLKRRKKS